MCDNIYLELSKTSKLSLTGQAGLFIHRADILMHLNGPGLSFVGPGRARYFWPMQSFSVNIPTAV